MSGDCPASLPQPQGVSDAGVLVLIVNYNGGGALIDCVSSVLSQSVQVKIVVIDNGSQDGSDVELLRHYDEVALRKAPYNLGFGGAINLAVTENVGDTIVILNPDVVLGAGCLEEMLAALQRKPGVIGPSLNITASSSTEVGGTINHVGMPTVQKPGKDPLYVHGCVVVTSRRVFEQVSGFDERYFLFVEDVEFCWRALLAGFDVSIAPNAEATHEGGGSNPGGYPRKGSKYRTSEMRVSLRERNNIALMIVCAPWWWLSAIIPLLLGKHFRTFERWHTYAYLHKTVLCANTCHITRMSLMATQEVRTHGLLLSTTDPSRVEI